jgi:hypothetical protein
MRPYKSITLAEIEAMAALWTERLGLTEWEIEYRVATFKRTSTMRVHRSEQYDRACIKINKWVLTNTPPKDWHAGRKATLHDVEESIVHELLHCHLIQLDRWQKHLRNEGVHTDAYDVAVVVHDDNEEAIVDRLARALTRSYKAATMES